MVLWLGEKGGGGKEAEKILISKETCCNVRGIMVKICFKTMGETVVVDIEEY